MVAASKTIRSIREVSIRLVCRLRMDVVVDDTSSPSRKRRRLVPQAQSMTESLKQIDALMATSVETSSAFGFVVSDFHRAFSYSASRRDEEA